MQTGQAASEIGALLDRYLVNLDDDKLDDEWARALFTGDALVEFPMSRHAGVEGLAEYHVNALAAFAATQHLNSPAVVEFHDTDRATLRANLISTHRHHGGATAGPLFTSGTLVTGEARRAADGWRLSLLSFRVIWTTGRPSAAGGAANR